MIKVKESKAATPARKVLTKKPPVAKRKAKGVPRGKRIAVPAKQFKAAVIMAPVSQASCDACGRPFPMSAAERKRRQRERRQRERERAQAA